MKEKINYSSPEGQEFQEKPHVSLMPSLEFDGSWRVDLRFREDTSSSRIDAEFNFVDGYAPLSAALRDAIWYGDLLNLPVVKYEDASMMILKKQEGQSSKEQEKRLQSLMHNSSTQKFPTH